MSETVSSKTIVKLALQVFSKDELLQLPRRQRLALVSLIGQQLAQGRAMPSQQELQAIKDLILEEAWTSGYTRPSELGDL